MCNFRGNIAKSITHLWIRVYNLASIDFDRDAIIVLPTHTMVIEGIKGSVTVCYIIISSCDVHELICRKNLLSLDRFKYILIRLG